LSQKTANRALFQDLTLNLWPIVNRASVKQFPWYRVLPFDYAVVEFAYENLWLIFLRGRHELTVKLAPISNPKDVTELPIVLGVLLNKSVAEFVSGDVEHLGRILLPNINSLVHSYSATEYPAFKQKLTEKSAELEIARREAEWEINRRM
jgi:hypothetical protein